MNDNPRKTILHIEDVTIERAGRLLISHLQVQVTEGQQLAIVGPSGCGKTSLLLAIAKKIFFKGQLFIHPAVQPVEMVAQIHQFKNKSNTNDLYYQQRYHAYDAEDAITVAAWLGNEVDAALKALPDVAPLLSKTLVQLSNGEHKKVQLAKALSKQPMLLLMDQPFIGLDSSSRQWLHQKLNALAAAGITLVLVTGAEEIPACITHVLQLQTNGEYQLCSMQQFVPQHTQHPLHLLDQPGFQQMLSQLIAPPNLQTKEMVRLENVSVSYGSKQVLQNISWVVKTGERWLLHGPNGVGKSTLLSMITADHPQVYANKIWVFDKRRGSGESIWDIKKQIGFVSPELQMYFQQTATCYHTVASGLFDTIGLFRKLLPADEEKVQQWLCLFGFEETQHKPFRNFSTGEQRLILLARALIKNPPLLVLDEPLQGLDASQQQALIRWIDDICIVGHKTLIFVTHYINDRPACIDHVMKL
jgi:molybdate transport system ATP-binding protein